MGRFKNAKIVSFSIRGEVCELLEKCSQVTGQTKTSIVERALKDYFKSYRYMPDTKNVAYHEFRLLCDKTLSDD